MQADDLLIKNEFPGKIQHQSQYMISCCYNHGLARGYWY